MPLVSTKGAASAQGFGEFSQVTAVNYIEDVFSCFLETGAGTSFTINNGIDLSTKGGMVWMKRRSSVQDNYVFDTVRGASNALVTNDNAAQYSNSQIDSFTTTGFTGSFLASASTNVFWTFREQAKFFDVVTYTGNGTSSNTVNHSLGSVPGCIIVKCTSLAGGEWVVYHRSLASGWTLKLNTTDAETNSTYISSVTSTSFNTGPGAGNVVNGSGESYVAYLFAHDAGGFGLTGTDNVISCGSFTTDGSGNATVSLGYEPQWILYKESSNSGENWSILDSMRGFDTSANQRGLNPNTAGTENNEGVSARPSATGFTFGVGWFASRTFIYIAIRRGPMEVPTVGTSVYNGIARTGTGSAASVTGVGFPFDLSIIGNRLFASAVPGQGFVFDRLRGPTQYLFTSDNAAEGVNGIANSLLQDGYTITTDVPSGAYNFNTWTYIDWFFRRAPSFFDEVCYTGTASYTTFTHNLTVAPQLVIIKSRSNGNAWVVGSSLSPSASDYIRVSSTAAWTSGTFWDNSSFVATRPTTTTVTISPDAGVNASGITFVAYLFATCAGVSKVGSYTGTAATLQIDCGFTAGSRFVLIKRTDSTGDWYVWDSARGIIAGNDPYLLLNSTAAEVTSTDYVDTYNAGFELTSTAPAGINASGGTYIFLAIA